MSAEAQSHWPHADETHMQIDTDSKAEAYSPKSSSSSTPGDSSSLPNSIVDSVADSHRLTAAQPCGGTLVTFGSGMFGMLASPDEQDQYIPTVPEYFRNRSVISVAAGSSHALAVGSDSALYSWGSNEEGQRGLADKAPHAGVTEVTALQMKVVAGSAAGYAHSLALTKGGEVYAFGSGEMAQLGLTMKNRPKGQPPDLNSHASPALVRELGFTTKIISIATGENHSLALSSAGRVYSCGDGSRGALGLDVHRPSAGASDSGVRVAVFTELTSLLPVPISSISAGAHHSLFVSAGGSVYACGDSSKGRLGFAPLQAGPTWLPRRILGELDQRHVLTAAAGGQYSLFLTQDHFVYACGSNAHGELGLDPALTIVESPTCIPGLHSVIQISAGSTHSLARDASNQVWSFGSNECGELGWSSDTSLKRSLKAGLVALPTLYPHQHIVSISAGSNISFVIIAQTIITTSIVEQKNRNQVASPTMRITATTPNAAAGATYQLYTPTSNRGERTGFQFDVDMTENNNRLGLIESDVPQFIVPPLPTPIPLSSFSFSHFSSLLRNRNDWITLANYLSHCFSSALLLNSSFLPSSSIGGGSYIDSTTLEAVYQSVLKASIEVPTLQHALATGIQKMVANMVILLKQSRQPPKDINAYRCIFIALQAPHLLKATASETQLLTDIAFVLTRLPRDVQTRVSDYIYPHIPLKLVEHRFLKVLLVNVEQRFKAALQGAGPNARLRTSSEEVQAIIAIVDAIHTSVANRRTPNSNRIVNALQPESAHGPSSSYDSQLAIPNTAWHIDVHRYIDLQTDLNNFLTPTPTAAQLPPFSFMRFPYLLSPLSKVSYLRLEFSLSMQEQILGAAISGLNPHLELSVRRGHLVDDTVNALNASSLWELRRPLKVSFAGEAGEDQGGLTAEFFETVFHQLAQPQYHLWEVKREWKTMWFSSLPMDPSKAGLYQIVGMLLGMCVYNGMSVQLNLPIWLYAQLLGRKPTLADLKSIDSQLAHSLEELLAFKGDVENTFCLTFEVSVPERTEEEIAEELQMVGPGSTHNNNALLADADDDADSVMTDVDTSVAAPSADAASQSLVPLGSSPPSSSQSTALVPARPRRYRNVPLLPGGEDIPVTQSNKSEYVSLYLDYLFTKSVSGALQPLIDGFQSIVGRVRTNSKGEVIQSDTASMRIFTPEDLELLIVGRKEMSFEDLKRGTRYEGGYSASHPTIVAFWSIVLDDLTPSEQRQLLLFTTGSSRAPVGGLAEVRMLIQRAGPDSDNLPTSSTCFAALILPEYANRAKLKEKLKLALENATGFGLR